MCSVWWTGSGLWEAAGDHGFLSVFLWTLSGLLSLASSPLSLCLFPLLPSSVACGHAFPLTWLKMGPHYSFALMKSSIYMFNLRVLHAFFLTISESFGSKMCIDYCLEMNVHMCRVGSGWLQLERGDQVEDSPERGS